MNYTHYPVVCSQIGEVAVGVSQGVDWTTGGGFSNLTTTPSWQKKAVSTFLQLSNGALPPSQFWNSSGRGYPGMFVI
jgi:hypothetical protein